MIAKHIYVSGVVQGVFYRASTVTVANKLGLHGWVRNLVDGRVELQVQGKQQQIEQLIEWLWQGPEHAKVDEVVVEPCSPQDFNEFKQI